MKKSLLKSILFTVLTTTTVFSSVYSGTAQSEQETKKFDMYAGYFSREGNNENPAKNINNNIYIKLYKNKQQQQWIATLFVPYPYATTVGADVIASAFDQIQQQTTTSAYLRGTFGSLKETSTVQIEKFGFMEDKVIFECGALSPCSIKPTDGYLELVKPGVINEHIIKYNQVLAP